MNMLGELFESIEGQMSLFVITLIVVSWVVAYNVLLSKIKQS